ncbi:MAG TPA: FkbM family methyltransferase [Terriglobales bacterium]|nr:FkbM family methyltransferase [Terriglobales bacterium]
MPLLEVPVGLWQGLKWYYETCGSRGVRAVASFRLFGRPRELSVAPLQSNHQVHLRIDTSDFCAYRDVLIFRSKSYDPGIPGFSPNTIVDAGAHIGMASILFAQRYPMARIIAVEPEPSNFAALIRNTAPYKTITPIQAALWRQDGEVTLGPSNAHPKGAFQIVENGQQRVRAITMDTLMRETGIESIDLLKVDIEGAEVEVFESCPWISNARVIAIELHDRVRPGCSSVVTSAAKDLHCDPRGEVTFFVRQREGAIGYLLDPPAAAESTAA